MIKIKKINDLARIPVRANPTDAGADLYSTESLIIPPLSRALVKTGLIIEIPENYYGRIAPRSGLAFKNGIDVMAGVIDSGYRNEVGVILYNTDQFKGFEVKIGDRIAQLIIEAHYNFKLEETSELSDTERGSGGFGSTGYN
jgi:dUTP pyrophosphatase